MTRVFTSFAILLLGVSLAPAEILTFVYKDYLNNPTNPGANGATIFADGTLQANTPPLPTATMFEVVATFDTNQPDLQAANVFGGLASYTPLTSTLTVHLPSGSQTYTFVQNFTSPYHNRPGENLNGPDLNRTDIVVFDRTNADMPFHFGVGMIEDPWIDGAGFVGDYSTVSHLKGFDVTNITSNTFVQYNGTGFLEGPGNPFRCGEPDGSGAITECTTRYPEPIKLLGSDGKYYWLALTDGDTRPGTYNATAALTQALRFQPLSPCRVFDTRLKASGPLQAKQLRAYDFLGSGCNIPATAQAYSINVTVVPQQTLGYLTVWATGATQPTVSTLNSLDGRIKSNAAIVAAGEGGKVNLYATDQTDAIVDVNGYFVPAETDPTALQFYPLSPCRIVDTRGTPSPLSGPSLVPNQSRNFPVLSGTCPVSPSAQAYVLNYTAVPQAKLGYLTTWPGPNGTAPPKVSTLNAPTGTITANAAIVPAGTDGSINVFASDATDLVLDVTGYFAPPGLGGESLYMLYPCRAADSRANGAAPWATTTPVSFTQCPCGVPAASQAFVTNATVVPQGTLGYLTLWPDLQPKPLASMLNATDGQIASNLAIVPSTDGSIDVFGNSPTHVVLDVSGYFMP